jgi:hypothetical protein
MSLPSRELEPSQRQHLALEHLLPQSPTARSPPHHSVSSSRTSAHPTSPLHLAAATQSAITSPLPSPPQPVKRYRSPLSQTAKCRSLPLVARHCSRTRTPRLPLALPSTSIRLMVFRATAAAASLSSSACSLIIRSWCRILQMGRRVS